MLVRITRNLPFTDGEICFDFETTGHGWWEFFFYGAEGSRNQCSLVFGHKTQGKHSLRCVIAGARVDCFVDDTQIPFDPAGIKDFGRFGYQLSAPLKKTTTFNIQASHEETGAYTVGQITDPGIDVPDLDLLGNAQLMRYAPDMLTILDHFLDELAHHCNAERPLSGPYEDAEAIVRLFKDK